MVENKCPLKAVGTVNYTKLLICIDILNSLCFSSLVFVFPHGKFSFVEIAPCDNDIPNTITKVRIIGAGSLLDFIHPSSVS